MSTNTETTTTSTTFTSTKASTKTETTPEIPLITKLLKVASSVPKDVRYRYTTDYEREFIPNQSQESIMGGHCKISDCRRMTNLLYLMLHNAPQLYLDMDVLNYDNHKLIENINQYNTGDIGYMITKSLRKLSELNQLPEKLSIHVGCFFVVLGKYMGDNNTVPILGRQL